MSRIINGEAVEKHVITNYSFKNLDEEGSHEEEFKPQKTENIVQPSPQQPSVNSVNEEVLENLLSKIEELSNNIVTIRNDFQNQLNECKQTAAQERQKAFEEGYNKGVQDAQQQLNQVVEEKLHLLQESIRKLDEVSSNLENKVESLEKELVSVALDIAKEVIVKEVSKESEQIALALAKSLIEELKDASKIEIRVNPVDYEYLKENLKNVHIVPDEAIKEGGVIISTDAGNIDAEIESRFKAIKQAVLEEK